MTLVKDGQLRIAPRLPEVWDKLTYTLLWKGQKLEVTVTKDNTKVRNLTGTKAVEVEVNGQVQSL